VIDMRFCSEQQLQNIQNCVLIILQSSDLSPNTKGISNKY